MRPTLIRHVRAVLSAASQPADPCATRGHDPVAVHDWVTRTDGTEGLAVVGRDCARPSCGAELDRADQPATTREAR